MLLLTVTFWLCAGALLSTPEVEFLILLLDDPGSWGGFQRILPRMAEYIHGCVRSEVVPETLSPV